MTPIRRKRAETYSNLTDKLERTFEVRRLIICGQLGCTRLKDIQVRITIKELLHFFATKIIKLLITLM